MDTNVIIRLPNRVIKGATDLDTWVTDVVNTEDWLSPPVHTQDAAEERIPLENIKAVFFVKSFDGKGTDELRYYDNLTPLPCLWVRITFLDGEIVEGMIRNDGSVISGSRFLMAPVDPQSNNQLMLVFKDQLADFQVLGLRTPFDELPEFFKQPLPPISFTG